ncbi:hypothetical protein HDV57DRAFT_403171 [Trichoderma longibrachiatum]|uniref:Uncharacterized protein n=1 Tax=Trichoderma longibrachiatum ATCC 18648 TaxID=983965 RepID=A0A2T4C1X3_TRILO|nr:hypothetical protein M440DRAFT_1257197 [Trichoderma longibrachiatum ATCC 18648]
MSILRETPHPYLNHRPQQTLVSIMLRLASGKDLHDRVYPVHITSLAIRCPSFDCVPSFYFLLQTNFRTGISRPSAPFRAVHHKPGTKPVSSRAACRYGSPVVSTQLAHRFILAVESALHKAAPKTVLHHLFRGVCPYLDPQQRRPPCMASVTRTATSGQ